MDTSGRNEFPPCRVAGRSLRDKVRSSVTREELGVEPLLLRLRIERSQLRWLGHLFRMPPGRLPQGGVPGMSHQEEASGKTQDTLEKLCLSAGLGTPRGPPEELEEVSGACVRSVNSHPHSWGGGGIPQPASTKRCCAYNWKRKERKRKWRKRK
ncbi:hypothetical protein L3Q82_003603 [Scortum barcoo]|uniref:Uncharacterized protein n=1 Tax=Scortum barcoo TaxID=214431 RepID=A0ACB8VMS0_9TELE|nr:hypothetical protein L3Q82_003603 [Scortum barcoo]